MKGVLMEGKDEKSSWLTSVVLGASKIVGEEQLKKRAGLEMMQTYRFFDLYGVKQDGKISPLVQTSTYRIYLTVSKKDQIEGLMKITTDPKYNIVLEQETGLLKMLRQKAETFDKNAAAAGQQTPNYGAFFPRFVNDFMADDRKAILLGFDACIETYKQLQPLSLLTQSDRIDLQSSVWVLGKLLKTLDFIHRQGFAVGNVSADNILLETDLHGVFVLDFSSASTRFKSNEIAQAAQIVWNAAGGTETSNPPFDEGVMSKESYEKYVAFLSKILAGGEANLIHKELYTLSDEIWPRVPIEGGGTKRPFHEFCVYPREIEICEENKEVL